MSDPTNRDQDQRALVKSSGALVARTPDERDELLTILDFILFQLERYERKRPGSVGRTLVDDKYTIMSLSFWFRMVRESPIRGMDPQHVQEVFNRAIKFPPQRPHLLGGKTREGVAQNQSQDIRYFQWIIRYRIRELGGRPAYRPVDDRQEMGAVRKKRTSKLPGLNAVLNSRDYYHVLGIDEDADQEKVKKHYRKQALRFHPDRHTSESEAARNLYERAFRKVTEAYETLRDSRRRAEYDASLH